MLERCDLCGGALSPWPEEDGSHRCMSCGQLQKAEDAESTRL